MPDIKLPVENEPESETAAPEVRSESSEPSGQKRSEQDIPEELNLLPLRDSVIYPMLLAPLSVGRPASMKLIDESTVGTQRLIGVVTQRAPQTDEPGFEDVYDVGCVVIIRNLDKTSDGIRLMVQGITRFRVVERIHDTPYLRAKIQVLEDPEIPEDQAEEIEALRRSIRALFRQAIAASPVLPDELRAITDAIEGPGVMADMAAAHVLVQTADKQAVLEAVDVRERLHILMEALSKEVRVLELSNKVHSEVTQELSRSQREYYLREQLRAIQRELGEFNEPASELSRIETELKTARMPRQVQEMAMRELERAQRTSHGSPEYGVIVNYLRTLASIPWSRSTQDDLDLAHVREVLDRDHYGLEKIKRRIVEFLAVRIVKTSGTVRQPILCFAGPPGVGKTSLGRSIASAIGRKFVRISLGGMRDEAEIRGHRRTYIGAMPGQIVQGLRRAEFNNPVFMLDEIDKLGKDFRGDPASALLEVLDPEQNATFRDHYVDAELDLSNVMFVTTANRLDTIPPPLLDRMEVIELGGYTEEEKLQIALRHLVPKQVAEHGLRRSKVAFSDDALSHLIRHYTREAGVRNLEREIASVLRRATLLFAEGRKSKLSIGKKFVESALGAPRYLHDEVAERDLRPGIAVGLAWTPSGGDVLFIESAKMAGKKSLTVTGQLGEVMKESVSAALSYVRANAEEFGLDPKWYEDTDLHVHVPAGAVPKDGPSAGVTMLTAIVSLLTGRKTRPRLAMTGELTLTGQVLPVGGIKEKVLAAHRAGVETVILPQDNRKDYFEDVPLEIRDRLTAHFVTRASEVLALALEP